MTDVFPMTDVTYLLDCVDSCNNLYFNDAIPSSGEYSLDVVPVSFGYDPHTDETWKELSSAESLQLYKDKNVLRYAAVQFVIDSSKKIKTALPWMTLMKDGFISKRRRGWNMNRGSFLRHWIQRRLNLMELVAPDHLFI